MLAQDCKRNKENKLSLSGKMTWKSLVEGERETETERERERKREREEGGKEGLT